MATMNLLVFSRARYTLPNLPEPSGLPMSKLSMVQRLTELPDEDDEDDEADEADEATTAGLATTELEKTRNGNFFEKNRR